MSREQNFKKLDELTNGLRNISGLSDEEQEKTPERKKWRAAIDALPEEERKEYYNRAYQKSRLAWKYKGENIDEEECNKLNTYGVRPDVNIIFFRHPDAKGDYVEAFDRANYNVVKGKGKIQNLYYPETVQVDYSEYSEKNMYNKSLFTKRYKDGLLIVMRGHKFVKNVANNLNMMILRDDYEDQELTPAFKLLKINQETLRVTRDINWKEDCFKDQLILYIIDPHVHKTKALKIVIKNNEHINKNINRLCNLSPSEKFTLGLPSKLGGVEKGGFKGKIGSKKFDFNHLFDNFFELTEEAQWFLEYLIEHEDDPERFRVLLKLHNISKEDLLRIGWKASLIEMLNNVNLLRTFQINVLKKGVVPSLEEQNFFSGIVDMASLTVEEAGKRYGEFIDQFKTFSKFILSESCRFHGNKHGKEFIIKNSNIMSSYMNYMAFKSCHFLLRTDEGTVFGNYKIDVSDMTEVDCLLYWREIEMIDIVSVDMFKNKRCPIMFRESKVINDLELLDPLLTGYFRFIQGSKSPLPKISVEAVFEDFEFSRKDILKEAMEQSTGYCFHEEGFFQMRGDPIFKGMRFREDESSIYIVILDKNERYITETFDKKTCDFKYLAWSRFKMSSDFSKKCIDEIYIRIASIIRDFKVVIKRDKVLGFRGYRRPKDLNTDSKYYVYLPRSSYIRNRSRDQEKREKKFINQNKIFTGPRRAHIRKLPDGYKISKVQELLAKKMEIYLPPNYTYVKKSKYGENGMTKREIIYRSKSLNGLFYYTKNEKSEFDKINEMSPAGFEEYCHELVEKNGWEVYKNTPKDGGIDIRALKEEKDGKLKTLLVQCKLHRKPIPPGAVRDFKAGCDDEKVEGEKQLMFISFSKFSPGAISYANQHDIMLVDGDSLIENKKLN